MKIYISNAFDGCDSKRVESKLEICFSNTGNCIRLINRFIKNDIFKRGISYYYIVLLYLIVITIVINFVLNCRGKGGGEEDVASKCIFFTIFILNSIL